MKWKKFKKERISLNYTVMLLPHSQKKPIHFKTPVWTFGLFFLGILVLSGTCLFFAGSRIQLKQVREEKAQLEREWEDLAAQKQKADKENEELRQAQETQEQELRELEQKTRDTIKELEDLVERESQIRQELGLQQIAESDGMPGREAENPEGEASDADNPDMADPELEPQSFNEPSEDREAGTPQAGGGMMQLLSTEYSVILAENTVNFQGIQDELGILQTSLSQKTSQYQSYLDTIEERKAAEAAELARQEELRLSIVRNALQFVGNPYVYGGNNPNTGVDCSGFTKYIMANTAGVYLNRTAASQSVQGHVVTADEARPGDLVFYSNGRNVNHVAIYIGDGRVVHASNPRLGITTSDMNYRTPVKIVNVLGD